MTGQYDNFRSGANLNEDALTPANVNSSQFGYLFAIGVDANPIYAQPLIVHNLKIDSTTYCTVVLTATMDNYIYAFDGDNAPTVKQPYLWRSQQFDGPPAPFVLLSRDSQKLEFLARRYLTRQTYCFISLL